VDSLRRVIEGQDISDLVLLAQQAPPVQQAAPAA